MNFFQRIQMSIFFSLGGGGAGWEGGGGARVSDFFQRIQI